MERAGFVGLGVMGAPMARHLSGVAPTVVFNRTSSKSDPFRKEGIDVARNLAELAAECRLIFLCVNRTEDVRSCLDELLKCAAPGTLFVDHSTISPAGAIQFHGELSALGLRYVDAPITGGSMGAVAGKLTIFCGGTESDVNEAKPYLAAYSKRAERVGGPGAGQMMKLANQIAVGGALQGLCECLAFAQKAGLDLAQARELIGSGAGGSWAFEYYGPKILNRDWSPGFSVKNQRKDFGYCREAAEDLGAQIPGTELTDGLLALLDEEGNGDWTTAALFEVLTRQ